MARSKFFTTPSGQGWHIDAQEMVHAGRMPRECEESDRPMRHRMRLIRLAGGSVRSGCQVGLAGMRAVKGAQGDREPLCAHTDSLDSRQICR